MQPLQLQVPVAVLERQRASAAAAQCQLMRCSLLQPLAQQMEPCAVDFSSSCMEREFKVQLLQQVFAVLWLQM